MRGDESFHQSVDIFGLWGGEVNYFLSPVDCFTDIVLTAAKIAVTKARVDDSVLQLDQLGLVAKVLALSQLQKRDESFSSRGVRLDVLNLERGFGLLGI